MRLFKKKEPGPDLYVVTYQYDISPLETGAPHDEVADRANNKETHDLQEAFMQARDQFEESGDIIQYQGDLNVALNLNVSVSADEGFEAEFRGNNDYDLQYLYTVALKTEEKATEFRETVNRLFAAQGHDPRIVKNLTLFRDGKKHGVFEPIICVY